MGTRARMKLQRSYTIERVTDLLEDLYSS